MSVVDRSKPVTVKAHLREDVGTFAEAVLYSESTLILDSP